MNPMEKPNKGARYDDNPIHYVGITAMHRPLNTSAFKKPHRTLMRYLYDHCIIEETSMSRLWFPASWAWWLLFDLKAAPMSNYGWRMVDVNSVVKYVKPGYLEPSSPHYPKSDDWITQSIVAMINAGVLLHNSRSGQMRKIKESRYLERHWDRIELVEVTVDRNKMNTRHSNEYLARRLDSHEKVLKQICGLLGLDEI